MKWICNANSRATRYTDNLCFLFPERRLEPKFCFFLGFFQFFKNVLIFDKKELFLIFSFLRLYFTTYKYHFINITSTKFKKKKVFILDVRNWWNCKKYLISSNFPVWKFCGKTNRPKLCGNCAFPQNLHTRKFGETTVFFAVW